MYTFMIAPVHDQNFGTDNQGRATQQWQRRYVACFTCYLYCFRHCQCCCCQRCYSGNHCRCRIHCQAFRRDPTLHDVQFCQEFIHAGRHSHALRPTFLPLACCRYSAGCLQWRSSASFDHATKRKTQPRLLAFVRNDDATH